MHHGPMGRRATTVQLDDALLDAVEAAAARTGQSPESIIENAVRARFAAEQTIDDLWARLGASDLSDDESLDLAYGELRAMRADRDHKAAS